MFLKPNFDRILAKKIEAENKTLSGIELNVENDVEKAEVLDIAKNLKENCEIEIGDTIYYEPFLAVNLEKENLVLIKLIDILGYEKKVKTNN